MAVRSRRSRVRLYRHQAGRPGPPLASPAPLGLMARRQRAVVGASGLDWFADLSDRP